MVWMVDALNIRMMTVGSVAYEDGGWWNKTKEVIEDCIKESVKSLCQFQDDEQSKNKHREKSGKQVATT